MREYIDKLVEKRNRAWHQAKDVLTGANSENRDLTSDEREFIDRAFADIDALGNEIKDLEAREARMRESEVAREAYADLIRPEPEARPVVDDIDAFLRGQSDARVFNVDLRRAVAERQAIRAGATGRELRDLSTSAAAGGNTIPTSFERSLYEYLESYNGLLATPVTVVTTASGEALEFPKVATFGTAAAVAEGSALAENDPTFAKMTLNAYKYGQLLQMSSELLADSGVDIVGFAARDLGRAIARVTDTDYVAGNGSSKPQGVMAAAATAKTGGTGQVGVPTIAELIDVLYSVDSEHRNSGSAAWFMRDATAGKIRQLTTTDGDFLWQPSVQAGQPDRLLGFPVYTDPNVAATGTNANSVAFGNFSAFYVRIAGPVRIERSDDFAFANDLVTWRAVLRTDSDLIEQNAIKLYRGGTA